MTCFRLTLRTSRRPHGQSERNFGPHYCYDTLVYRHDACILAVEKNILVWRSRSGPLKPLVSPPYRDRIVAAFEVHHHKDGDAHWATLPYIIL